MLLPEKIRRRMVYLWSFTTKSQDRSKEPLPVRLSALL